MALITACTGNQILPAAPLQPGASTGAANQNEDLFACAQKAISPDSAKAAGAIKILRAAGPQGLQTLTRVHQNLLQRSLKLAPKTRAGHPEWKRLKFALDQTGAQCDNWASGLYWFTDLEKAKAEADRQNKPILSLRLLGNLNDELSCANSRFFRTALYPNKLINSLLKNQYILHWQSVRPVPKVTIDFGDGRKIQTTITGNSIHYLLDSQGQVMDALPGLYGPGAFYKWLSSFLELDFPTTGDASFNKSLQQFHVQQLAMNTQSWKNDIARLKMAEDFEIPIDARIIISPAKPRQETPGTPQISAQALTRPRPDEVHEINDRTLDSELVTVTARVANGRSYAKAAMVESRLLKEITIPLPRDRNALRRTTTDDLWAKIASLHEADARLDENSLAVLRAKTLNADKAAFNFQKSIAEDSVRNEYSRHSVIHQWLVDNPGISLNALNKKVYAELFLTPDSDPWLGLLPADVYSGIQNDGVTNR